MPEQFVIEQSRIWLYSVVQNFCQFQRTEEETTNFSTEVITTLTQRSRSLGYEPDKPQDELIASLIEAINKQLP